MYYVGVDYHKRYSVATVLNSAGEMLARQRLDNRLEAFRELLEPYDKDEIEAVVEATRSWGIPVDMLEQLAGRVILANPGEVKLIAKGRIKTDKVDSLALAKLLRVGWVPEAYLRPRTNREHQLILRVRCFLVQLRTRVKNRIHDLIDRQDEPIRETATGFSDLFGKKGMVWLKGLDLSHPFGTLLCRLLAAYDALNAEVRQSDRLVAELFAADEDCQRLVKTPGIGTFFSVLIKTEVGTIERFSNSARFCSYAGVVPSTESSGGKVWHGRTIKQSNRWLRWALVEAVIPAMVADAGLRAHYEYYRRTKGSKVAKVVTARRIGCIVYRVLKEKQPFYERPVTSRGYRQAG
jgi:transposase